MLETLISRPRIHLIAFGGRAPPGPAVWGSLQRSPRPLAVSKEGRAGDGNEREVEKERNHRKQREKIDQGKGRETWNNGVCAP